MRIAYLTQFYPPSVNGVAAVVQRLAEGMARRGHQVLVIAPSDRPEPYQVREGNLTILRLRSTRNQVDGQRVLIFPRTAIREALRQFSPQVIHSHENMAIGLLALEYGRSTGTPVVTTLHQLPWLAGAHLAKFPELAKIVEAATWLTARRVLPNYAALIAPTQTVSELVGARTQVSAHRISNGVDLGLFHASPLQGWQEAALRARLGLPSGAPVILHVGRLDAGKNVNRVVLAAGRTMQDISAHLLVVGDGTEKQALLDLSRGLGIASRCHFTGFVRSGEGLPEIYRLASLFVTASEIETQGLVLLEAAASGLPIVAERATCIPEIVRHGLNGYLAEPGDTDGLARAMTRILSTPSQARAMGRQSTLLARAHDVRHSLEAHEQLYLATAWSHSTSQPAPERARSPRRGSRLPEMGFADRRP